MTRRLSLEHFAEAALIVDPVFLATPQFVAESLSEARGVRIVVKVETLNPVRCFVGRGADCYAATLSAGAPVVTASSGKLGQAPACVCRGCRRQTETLRFSGTAATGPASCRASPTAVRRPVSCRAPSRQPLQYAVQ